MVEYSQLSWRMALLWAVRRLVMSAVCLQMKDYCTDDKACRHSLLLDYFGERFAGGRCGNACDNCIARQAETPQLDSVWQVATRKSGLPIADCTYSLCHLRHKLDNDWSRIKGISGSVEAHKAQVPEPNNTQGLACMGLDKLGVCSCSGRGGHKRQESQEGEQVRHAWPEAELHGSSARTWGSICQCSNIATIGHHGESNSKQRCTAAWHASCVLMLQHADTAA